MYALVDANYYHLPRLINQLATSEIFMRIGTHSFKIPRNIFSNPGDTPNFFTVGFVGFFGSGIEMPKHIKFIRPPPMAPPTVPNRSCELFADLLKVLRGGPVEVRSREHRALLLKECRYYRFRNLEQRLIEHSIDFNRLHDCEEITINLEDMKFDNLFSLRPIATGSEVLFYKRPFVDKDPRELIIQITGQEQVQIYQEKDLTWKAKFFDKPEKKLSKLWDVLTTRLSILAPLGQEIEINTKGAYVTVDGSPLNLQQGRPSETPNENGPNKRSRIQVDRGDHKFTCLASQWRVIKDEGKPGTSTRLKLQLVMAKCYLEEEYKNSLRKFL